MPELDKPTPSPWPVPVSVDKLPDDGQHFDLVADAETRTRIAPIAGLRELPRLEASFDVTRHGEDGLHVVGRISATVGQTCVVTLEPLANEIEEDVDLVFLPSALPEQMANQAGADGEKTAAAKWNGPEPLIGGIVDLGAISAEFLILGLDPYPRKPGAVFEAPRDLTPEASPFAALAGWTKGRNDH